MTCRDDKNGILNENRSNITNPTCSPLPDDNLKPFPSMI